ncbi:hypothetical protein RDI58_000947 [Solanum bulbocastanum]|uniref:Uncharacterized protein n=1 Tax=Solanum bulbocastanum TaxID=147425 RepID=A0AAN8U8I2_SOLBU
MDQTLTKETDHSNVVELKAELDELITNETINETNGTGMKRKMQGDQVTNSQKTHTTHNIYAKEPIVTPKGPRHDKEEKEIWRVKDKSNTKENTMP